MRRAIIGGLVLLAAAAVTFVESSSEAAGGIQAYNGTFATLQVMKDGTFTMHIVNAGSTAQTRINSCGARIHDQPLLMFAFQNKRLMYLTTTAGTDGHPCLSTVMVKP